MEFMREGLGKLRDSTLEGIFLSLVLLVGNRTEVSGSELLVLV